jgi:RES domain-containing protein
MASRFDGRFEVFRIASATYPIFDGGGARRFGSRWCTPGRSIIHTASAYALALLENLVHWNATRLPPDMRFVVATIPATLARDRLEPEASPGWDRADYSVSRAFGDAWYDRGETALLIVPSALSPFEPNVLINQHHPDAARIDLSPERRAILDQRLIRP